MGSYAWNDPGFHGTPEQRQAMAYLGVKTAIDVQKGVYGRSLTYRELHAIFLKNTKTLVGGRIAGGIDQNEELDYPNLTYEQRQKFFPHD